MMLMLVENHSAEEEFTTLTFYRPDFYLKIFLNRKISNERIIAWIPVDEFDLLDIRNVLRFGWFVIYNEKSNFS